MTFEKLTPLSKPLAEEVKKLGFTDFTEIQLRAIPKILEGRNVLIISPTGTGKTEAAILPVLDLLLRARSAGEPPAGIAVLYVTPLRALNRDIFRRLIQLGENLGVKIEVRHGDTEAKARRLQAKSPPDMLILTPETLQAILVGKKMSSHLRGVRWVVIDEIHELASDKRGVQLAVALERLAAIGSRDFQRIGLSATVGRPETIAGFLAGEGRRFEIVEVEGARETHVRVESPEVSPADEQAAERLLLPVGLVSRLRRIVELAQVCRSMLVFTNTREHAESLSSKIKLLRGGVSIGVHHGSLSREVRVETENKLKAGCLRALICTSSLELGIDVGWIDFVLQYGSPRQVCKLVQRLGRSGHVVRGAARGCVIAGWPDEILESAVIAWRAKSGLVEEPTIHFNALDVLAHQLVGLVLDRGRLTLQAAYETVRRAFPYRNLSFEELVWVAKQLESEGKVRLFGEELRAGLSRPYYFENLSMIPDVKQYAVVEHVSRSKVGVLDAEFIARNGKAGNQFILFGNVWQILAVDDEQHLVEVASAELTPAAIPAWEGEIIPVPFEVAQEVARLRREISEELALGGNPLAPLEGLPLADAAKKRVVEALERQRSEGYPVPHDRLVLIETFENYTLLHCCLGDRVNQTLSRILATMITLRTGVEVAVQADAYRISLLAPYTVDPFTVRRELLELTPEGARKILDSTLDQTNLFLWRLWHNARRFGVVSKKLEYRLSHARLLHQTLKGTPVYRETFRELYAEHFDLENLTRFLEALRRGEIQVEVAPLKGAASPLSLPLLDKIAPHDLVQPLKVGVDALKLIRSRLESKTLRLVCAFKGDWEGLRTVRSLPERVTCPRCGSTLVAATFPDDERLAGVVKKKVRGKRLTPEEERIWRSAWKNASLIQNYGRRAALALAGRGVGPNIAARILRQRQEGEEDLYRAILKAEREYLRTRMFW